MNFNVSIDNRNFTTKPIRPDRFKVQKLTWSAFGGCDQAFLTAQVPPDRLLEFSSMLRCPVMISDGGSIPVWWGYINTIKVYFERSQFEISLDNLFNKVRVIYSYISPDNKIADQMETSFAIDALSVAEYGTKEKTIQQRDIDDYFAIRLRDTFLALSSSPRSILAPNAITETPRVELSCLGWFHSLSWETYQYLEGFYANYGPGPGFVSCYAGSNTAFAQSFVVAADVKIKSFYFSLRKVGAPVYIISGDLCADVAGFPGGILVGSTVMLSSTVNETWNWHRFEFVTPYQLTAGTRYWINIYPNGGNSTNFIQVKTDENLSFIQPNQYAARFSGSWQHIANITNPNQRPDAYFRIVCVLDSGSIISAISQGGGKFFNSVDPCITGIEASPYRNAGRTCLEEVTALMQLGTSGQRLVLADVNPQRRLTFYSQPPADPPTVTLDRYGRFITRNSQVLPAYRPPIGQYAVLGGIDRLVPPFDSKRAPAYFVDRAVYTQTSKVAR